MEPTLGALSVDEEQGYSQGSKTASVQLNSIIKAVADGINGKPSKDDLQAYAAILKSVADLQNSLPKNRTVSFKLTRKEWYVLLGYAVGGLLMMLATSLLPWVSWKSQDLINVLLYWSTIIAILLGAQALPPILGKGGSAPSQDKGTTPA